MSNPFWGLPGQNDFWSLPGEVDIDPRTETAVGRAGIDEEEKKQLLARYQGLLDDPKTPAEMKGRLKSIVEKLSPNAMNSYPLARLGANLMKGATSGARTLGDVSLAAIELGQRALPGEFKPTGIIRQGRRMLQEMEASVHEDLPTPGGAVDVVEQLVGGIASTGPAWASIARSTGQQLLKILPQGSKVAQLVRAAEQGNVFQRIAGQEVINLPVDALASLDQLDATTKQKLMSLGISIGGTALGASLPARRVAAQAAPTPVSGTPSQVDLSAPPRSQGTPDASTLGALQAQVRASEEAQAIQRAIKDARREFKKLYPELKWNDLTEEQKTEWVNSVKTGAPVPDKPEIMVKGRQMSSEEAAEGLANLAEETGQIGAKPTEFTIASTSKGQDQFLASFGTGKPGITVESPKLEGAGHTIVFRRDDGKPAGYYLVELGDDYAKGHEVFVSPDNRRQGIAKTLLKYAEDNLGVKAHGSAASPEGEALLASVAPEQQGTVTSVARVKPIAQLASEAEDLVARNAQMIEQANKTLASVPLKNLRTIPVSKPLREMSLEELDATQGQLKAYQPLPGEIEAHQSDMLDLALARRELASKARQVGPDPASPVFKVKQVTGEERAKPVETPKIEAPPKSTVNDPEFIVTAAIQTVDGKVYQGALHILAREAARKAGSLGIGPTEKYIDGFMTSKGRFVDRLEAEKIQASFESRDVRPGLGREFDAVDIPAHKRAKIEGGQIIPVTDTDVGKQIIEALNKIPEPTLSTSNKTYNPNQLRALYLANLTKMTPEELSVHRADIDSRIDATTEPMVYQKRLDEVDKEIARRANPPRDGGTLLQSPPEIGAAIGGYIAGWLTGDDPEERQSNALVGMSIGLGGTLGWRYKTYRSASAKPRPAFKGEEALNDVVVTSEQLRTGEKAYKPFASRGEMEVEGVMRPGSLMQKAVRLAGGRNLGWALNVGKQSVEGSDALNASIPYMVGTPTIHKLDGTHVQLTDVKNLHTILTEVNGDVKGLGNVAFALHTIEKAERYGKLEPKLTPQQALRYLENVPQSYINAAMDFRRLSSVLVEQGVELEMITRADADKMLAEQAYTPILRIYDEALIKSAQQVDLSPGKKASTGAPQPFKERQGTKRDYQVLNPIEAFSKNLVKYNWAFAEQRRKLTLLAHREAEKAALKAQGKDPSAGALTQIIRRVPGAKAQNTERYMAHVERIKNALNMREAEAEQAFDSFNPKPVADSDPHFSVWRNGVRETYAINEQLAETFRLPSQEAEALWFQALEALTKGVRFGVTRDPFFAMRMGVIDNWQSYLASNYGFRFGLDHLAGFLTLLDADKPAKFLSGVDDIKTAREGYMLKRPAHLLSDVFKADDPDALVKLAQQRELSGMESIKKASKEMKWGQVYNLLLSNIAEAGRMGLYLAATRKGASIDDAIYEATMAIGNYQTRGKRLEKLARIALFLNPAVKAMDAELTAMGIGPGSRSYVETPQGLKARGYDSAKALNYFTKGFTGIALPTIALYYLNKDDPEIERLRKTDAGRRFNFVRVGDQIVRVRKSFVSGQIFGTGVEQALDVMRDTDPAGFDQWLQTMIQDLPLNVLPTGVGAGLALGFGKDPITGIPIAGRSMSDRLPSEREGPSTSEPARRLGQALEPLSSPTGVPEFLRTAMSPVGIDFLVRALGGTLASEAMQGLTVAYEWSQQNYLRPAAELPLIRSALANQNTVQAISVERFYDLVERVDQTMTTLNHLKTDPVRMAKFAQSHRPYIALAPAVQEVRNEISEMRQSLEDVRVAPSSSIDMKVKTKYRNAINKAMLQRIDFFMNSMSQTIKALESQSK